MNLMVAAPTGVDFKDWVLLIAGNVFIAILAVRAIGYYAKREWGELVGHILGGIVVGGLVYATDESVAILKGLWGLIVGS